MTNKTQQICRSAFAMVLLCGAVSAQTITNSGVNQDLGSGWRTPATPKLDIDGNGVLGTDGYYMPKSNNQPVQTKVPAYVTAFTPLGGIFSSGGSAPPCGYAAVDDPVLFPALMCTGNINLSPGTGNQVTLLTFVLQGTVPSRIRVGIMVDNFDLTGFNSVAVEVDGVAAGPNVATTSAAFNNKIPDWIYFDIAGGLPGQVISIKATGGARGTAAIGGLAIDSAAPAQDAYQVRYAANLAIGDSVINFTNSGASSTDSGIAGGGAQNGDICANVYAYSPDEQLVSCCSCNVTPNALNSLSVKNDLASNTLTPIIPSALVVKVVVTRGGAACTASSAATASRPNFASGLVAWGTTIHAVPDTAGTPAGTYGVTETPFARPNTLSDAELSRMTQLCAFIRANGSGYGICKSCKVGGLGANSK